MGVFARARVVRRLRVDEDLRGNLTRLIEADTRPYVKRDTGQTERSASVMSDFDGGTLVYSAHDRRGRQYAGYAYDDPHVSRRDNNPKATAHWFQASARDHMRDWMDYVIREAIKNG